MPSRNHDRSSARPYGVDTKRRFFKDSSRRGPEKYLANTEYTDLSEEDEESLAKRIARLRQEAAEIKGEVDRRKALGKRDLSTDAAHEEDESLDALQDVLSGASEAITPGAAKAFTSKLSTDSKSHQVTKGNEGFELPENSQEFPTSTSGQSYQQTHTLSRIADFDDRLALLEKALGLDTIPLPSQETLSTYTVLPTLDKLDKQISAISSTTNSSLDSIDKRVKQLRHDADKLAESRKAAKMALEAPSTSSNRSKPPLAGKDDAKPQDDSEDPDYVSKINALYGTLNTIGSLAPLLPSLLDRLRSLQLVHADAAVASQNLSQLEARQEAMAEEIKEWREGLEKVELAMKHGEEAMIKNVYVVEGWVKELEERMQRIS